MNDKTLSTLTQLVYSLGFTLAVYVSVNIVIYSSEHPIETMNILFYIGYILIMFTLTIDAILGIRERLTKIMSLLLYVFTVACILTIYINYINKYNLTFF